MSIDSKSRAGAPFTVRLAHRRPLARAAAVLPAAFLIGAMGNAHASSLVPQAQLTTDPTKDTTCIPKFAVELPVFGPAGSIPRVDAGAHPNLTLTLKEIDQAVLPQGMQDTCGMGVTFGKTRVWAFETSDTYSKEILGAANWPAVTIEALRGIPARVTYVNKLPSFNPNNPNGPGLVQGLLSMDQTIHWADPLHANCPMALDCTNPQSAEIPFTKNLALCTSRPSAGLDAGIRATTDELTDLLQLVSGTETSFNRLFPQLANLIAPVPDVSASRRNRCCQPFTGPIPATVHLHGAEIPAAFDGGPDTWFTPNGITGPDYATLDKPGPGKAIYLYDNSQEPGTLWFHDHALGITRNNVYAGLAAFYFLRDPSAEPKNLPSGPYEIEMAIQDRRFDIKSQLFFPGSGPGPNAWPDPDNGGVTPNFHPFWYVQFPGDVATVNGAPWPYLKVEPRRYRLRLLNGANGRRFDLHFGGVPVWQIGADDNYFNTPVQVSVDKVCPADVPTVAPSCSDVSLLPGERADIIVDFTGLKGQTINLTNTAPSFLGPAALHDIMQFQVVLDLKGHDDSCDPAHPDPAKGICARPAPMVRLTDGNGNVAPGVKVDKVRQLVVTELNTLAGGANPAGEVEEFVNDTYWPGLDSVNIKKYFKKTDGVSELPQVGATELWELINPEPANVAWHPMHTHLVQFQILNRQKLKGSADTGFDYEKAYESAYGTGPVKLPKDCERGEFCPGYGPPLPYNTSNADGALGGNPAIGDKSTPSYLSGDPIPPDLGESGWKDTAKAFPGMVTRILVRWTPTSTPVIPNLSYAGRNFFPFDPTEGTYVWHCHIIDHEDNEMMRPYRVTN